MHGKLSREQENLEDLLTSNVFGTFSYFEPREALIPFLAKVEGDRADDLRRLITSPEITRAEYAFWPWLDEPGCKGCEPDVLVTLYAAATPRVVVLIESKYRSGKSSEADDSEDERPPNDQLAREWDNLTSVARGLPCFVVYVTADYVPPRDEIAESQADLVRRRGAKGALVWLSWRALPSTKFAPGLRMLDDVRSVMEHRYQLRYFEGVRVEVHRPMWRFAGDGTRRVSPFDWIAAVSPWRFLRTRRAQPGRAFRWPGKHSQCWRWSP